jgi:hypothetical protein
LQLQIVKILLVWDISGFNVLISKKTLEDFIPWIWCLTLSSFIYVWMIHFRDGMGNFMKFVQSRLSRNNIAYSSAHSVVYLETFSKWWLLWNSLHTYSHLILYVFFHNISALPYCDLSYLYKSNYLLIFCDMHCYKFT